MSELQLVTAFTKDGFEFLKTKTKPYIFSEHKPEDTKQLAHDLVAVLYKHGGLGLAANQVGLPWSIFAMRGASQDIVCFNPMIAMPSKETIKLDEGCLSFPGIVLKINRWRHVRVRYSDYLGQTDSFEYTGMTARVFQHELEHLNGEFFFDGVSRFHLERAMRQAKNKGFDYGSLMLLKYARRN